VQLYQNVNEVMPQDIFIENGNLHTLAAAMLPYRFAVIVDDSHGTISQIFVQALGYHTIPVFNGFMVLANMFPNGILPFNASVDLDIFLDDLSGFAGDKMKFLQSYHQILQEILYYRYASPFESRLRTFVEDICHHRPLFYVGIYSARANYRKRQAVRETWLRVFREYYNVRYAFFLGDVGDGTSVEEEFLRREMDQYNDIVVLGVEEGYRMNSKKGLRFAQWAAKNVHAHFLLKVDDDVYLRPEPLITQLTKRSPSGYVWAYFDFISPVPRDPDHHFYQREEDYPFNVFPPYPRGAVRVLSMDLMRRIAASNTVIFGDDPCMGVHLREIVTGKHAPPARIEIDDRDSYSKFAMEVECNVSWGRVRDISWAVHHASPEQLRCMWNADVESGYIRLLGKEAPEEHRGRSDPDWGEPSLAIPPGLEFGSEFADLCACQNAN
jgi:hypothetical protein